MVSGKDGPAFCRRRIIVSAPPWAVGFSPEYSGGTLPFGLKVLNGAPFWKTLPAKLLHPVSPVAASNAAPGTGSPEKSKELTPISYAVFCLKKKTVSGAHMAV